MDKIYIYNFNEWQNRDIEESVPTASDIVLLGASDDISSNRRDEMPDLKNYLLGGVKTALSFCEESLKPNFHRILFWRSLLYKTSFGSFARNDEQQWDCNNLGEKRYKRTEYNREACLKWSQCRFGNPEMIGA